MGGCLLSYTLSGLGILRAWAACRRVLWCRPQLCSLSKSCWMAPVCSTLWRLFSPRVLSLHEAKNVEVGCGPSEIKAQQIARTMAVTCTWLQQLHPRPVVMLSSLTSVVYSSTIMPSDLLQKQETRWFMDTFPEQLSLAVWLYLWLCRNFSVEVQITSLIFHATLFNSEFKPTERSSNRIHHR